MRKHKKIIIGLVLCIMMALPSQLVIARGSSSSHSSSGGFHSSSSFHSASSSSHVSSTPKSSSSSSGFKSSSSSKTSTPKSSSYKSSVPHNSTSSTTYKTYNTYRTTHLNTNYVHPTYHTYFTPAYYSFSSSNNFWSHYWMYQAISQHSMYPNNIVTTGQPSTYSRGHDVATVIILIIIGYAIYKFVRKKKY
ncbi:hypothetical protein [Clostridium estertheticum]|uniref:hypothetical protein n=1 Tax=Clostridium estertheticum TaxID=238834 RepID=UPI00124DF726|nr:hypothetical protein [Clostridium estertheticum]MBZ9615318.1 hypothetical protein [Clostridium estertheticum subsp. laramiense]WAG75207.1 hypothetical protein LL032_07080 [Clostridium estertheticum]